ncbi:MAG: hypothetical protein JXR96_00515 [Deltaproteobacteria bacterium]|nr:hypothetical protein [Deltaproteobacteria bacterium]
MNTHTLHRRLRFLGTLLILAALVGSCEEEERFRGYCTSDEDCDPGFRCDPQTGLCLCAIDEVCEVDEYCAPDGTCRKRMSCDTNLDCPEGMYCDTTTGHCIPDYQCTKDEQCPLGYVCSEIYFGCIEGCRTSGDCELGQVCIDGQCSRNRCTEDSHCDYGQLCDGASQTCEDDQRGPYCSPCTSGSVADPYQCGRGPNFCILTDNDPSLEPFCGVDCSQNQPCPHGYSCNLILVAPGGSCRSPGDCESEQCHINEGDEVGFCLCNADEQCPGDSCNELTMQCTITRRPCSYGGNECDQPIYCVDGLCLIGQNCAPVEGLSCSDLHD